MGNNQVTIRIADICVGIEPLYGGWFSFCRDYMTSEKPDFVLRATEADLAAEQERAAEYLDGEKVEGFRLEKIWVYRQIAETIPKYDAFLIHATSVRVDEDAYLFIGPSGAGKTTHARLWKKYFGDRLRVINDDKPIIKVIDDEILVCASPWSGKERWINNIIAPLKAVIWINQSDENSIEKISKAEAWDFLMNQVYRSYDADNTQRTLKMIDRVINEASFYALNCNRTFEAVELAYSITQ